jgi:hypothetical protein
MKTLITCIKTQHDDEEKYLFPGLAVFTGNPKIMEVSEIQYAAFHGGLTDIENYCIKTLQKDYFHITC